MSISTAGVVVVSGGSKGLGFRLCESLLADGYRVATFSRTKTPALEVLMASNPQSLYWEALDIARSDMLPGYTRRVKAALGRIGYLINGAGIANEGLLTTLKENDIDQMLQVNLRGTLHLSQACVKQMMVGGRGAIVNISSIVGVRGFKGVSAYGATKAALDGLTRGLAKELGSTGIRVNSVAPGFMETEMTSALTEQQKARIARQTPLARMGCMDDVVPVIKFLLSDASGFVTGQTLVVDGGLTV